jgi:translocation and assembly module TamB
MWRLRLLLLLPLLPPALVVLALLAANTPPARHAIAALLSGLLPGITITGIDGPLPGRVLVARIEVADADGPWLRVEGLRLEPDWIALLRGEARIRLAGADTVALLRLPAAGDAPSEPAPPAAPSLALPELPLPVALDRLSIRRILLPEALAGLPLVLSAEGSAMLSGGRLAADLRLTEAAGTTLALTAGVGAGLVSLRLDAADPAPGRLPALLGLPPGLSMLALSLDGPPEDAAFGLAVTLGETGTLGLQGRLGLGAAGAALQGAWQVAARAEGATLEAEGTLAASPAGLTLDLARLEASERRAGLRLTAPTTLRLAPDGVAELAPLALALRGGGTLTAEGRRDAEGVSARATLSNVPAALADPFLPGLGVRGSISGELRLRGDAATPDLEATLTGTGLAVAAPDLPPVPPLALRVTARAPGLARLSADFAAELGPAGRIGGTLALPGGFSPGAALALRLTGDVDIAPLVAPLLAGGADRVAGRLRLNAAAEGTLGAPRLSGTAQLSGGSWRNPVLGAALTDITASLRATANELVIESLAAATPGGGRITANGRVGLAGALPAEVTIAARGAQPIRSDLAAGVFDADLRLSGELLGASRLAGTVAVRRLAIQIPERLPAALRTIPNLEERGRGAARPAPRAAPAQLAETSLDVTIDAPRAVFLRGQGIDAELGGRIVIGGTLASPQPVGAFELRRGTLSVLDRRLVFNRGRVGFDGSLSPTLDLLATSRVRDVTLSVAVTGSASAPEISFTSAPQLPQDEILARLLFDRPLAQLTAVQIAQLAAGVAQTAGLTGGGGRGLLGRLRDALALDRLAIGSERNGEAPETATIEGGRYVADGVYLGITQDAQGGPPRVAVEIELLPRLRLEGRTGGATAGGRVGVTYEVEY